MSATGFAPTGAYSTHNLADTNLNRWAVIPAFAIHLSRSKVAMRRQSRQNLPQGM